MARFLSGERILSNRGHGTKTLVSDLDYKISGNTLTEGRTPPNVQEDGAGLDPEVVLLEHFESRHHVGF